MKYRLLFIIIVSFLPFTGLASSLVIKDLDSDWTKFSTQNYNLIMQAHKEAIIHGRELDYAGLDTIRLVIPEGVKSIPFPDSIDFSDVVFVVKNNQRDFALFEYSNSLTPIDIDKRQFCNSKFSTIKEFENKDVILVVTDENPWVADRHGYNRPHIRKDILVINNGVSSNSLIQPYDNESSHPSFAYVDVTRDSVTFKNLTVIRTEDSTHKTFCAKIQNANNLKIDNIAVYTPESELYGDAIFTFNNCANIQMLNVIIDGTYSQNDKYGYGISMNNTYNCVFTNVIADGKWGVFGTNNVNTVYIEDCDINRFDIHCYGKDVSCSNTFFRNRSNQLSSFYGDLIFDGCTFSNFVPVTIDGSYSAYTSFNVYFNDCHQIVDPVRPYLFNMTTSKFLIDKIRPELSSFQWPNVYISSMEVDCPQNTNYFIFHTYQKSSVYLDGKMGLQIDGLDFNCDSIHLNISNSHLNYHRLN